MMLDLSGANTLLVTPFHADGSFDTRSLQRLIDHVIAGGAKGIILLGSTGEFFGLSHDERLQVMRIGLEHISGRVPVTVGVGSDGTAETVQLAAVAQEAKADCLMVIPPIYFDSSAAAQLAHYSAIAGSTDLDVMLYDGSNGIRLSPDVLRQANEQSPNIRYAKIATADPGLFAAYRSATQAVTTIVGEDMMLFQGLRGGGRGSATAIGNILPREIAALHSAFDSGRIEDALELAVRISPVTMFLSVPKGGFIAKFKHILTLQGIIESDYVRPPLRPLTRGERAEIAHDVCPLLTR
ncbi:hypothetical protein C5C00_12195 [Rathayibacter rathayi]|uniref:dihydrodipicolinate synthase family protein n=1 Tax=Rathayibacter rathayi TaxID=33887 RepID=UPI000CE7981D|nr:dihydrodipicolinate synthase family protein [Rathayibacter rathayi]PPG88276.1 hypothetical protein C5C47_07780 [Rathayibacter rathayi]PPG94443.1 hypothetical protein C5C00_12195 [Rathayibacter rathayi]